MAARRVSGPCENQDFYSKYLESNPLFKDLVLANLGVAPFNNHWTGSEMVTMAYILNYGRHLLLNGRGSPDRTILYVVVMAELIGPELPVTMFLNQDRARRTFVNAVSALIADANLGVATTNTGANYAACIADQVLYPNDVYGDHAAEDIQLVEDQGDDVLKAVRVLRHLALGATSAFKLGGLALIGNITVAICKRGTMTEAFVEKISQGIEGDIGRRITLNIDAMKMYYQHFGSYITAANIEAISNRRAALIPQQAMRLILTVQQLAGSGLTAYITIGRAIRMYPDFSWAEIIVRFPTEYQNYVAALNLVRGNPPSWRLSE